jgi:hypothetical protein
MRRLVAENRGRETRMNVSGLSRRIAPIVGFGVLVSCGGGGGGGGTPATPAVPIMPFCSIVESESFINPPLHEANSAERLDATTDNNFNRMHGVSGPRGNPFIANNTDLYAVDEVWLHRASAAVVRAEVHPANRFNTTDGLASAWSLRFQDAAGAWSGPLFTASANSGNVADDPQTAARMVPQLMTVGSATTQVFACAGGRTEDNTGRTTWLLEVKPPATAASSSAGSVTMIEDMLYGDDHFLPNAPGPLRGPANPPVPNVHGPGDAARNGSVQCAMTQVGDNVATRELHMIALYNGVLYHSMASGFVTATSGTGPGFTFLRFASISPWASVTQALGGTFGDVVSAAIVASRQDAVSVFFVAKAGAQFTQYRTYHAVRFSGGGGSWRPADDVLALRDGAGAIPGFTPFNVAAGMCPAYPAAGTGDEIVYVQWNSASFATVGRVVSTPRLWPGTSITGIYSPATTLVGVIRGVDPARDFTLLHWSIGARPFGATATPPP